MIGRREKLQALDSALIEESIPTTQRAAVVALVGELLDVVQSFRDIAGSLKQIGDAQLKAAERLNAGGSA